MSSWTLHSRPFWVVNLSIHLIFVFCHLCSFLSRRRLFSLSFPLLFSSCVGQALTAHFEKATMSAGCTILAGCLAGCGGGILADLLRYGTYVCVKSVRSSIICRRLVGQGWGGGSMLALWCALSQPS